MPLIPELETYRLLLDCHGEQRVPPSPTQASGDAVTPSAPRAGQPLLAASTGPSPPFAYDAMRRCQPVRDFDGSALPREQLDFVTRAGLTAEREQWLRGGHPNLGMTVAFAALNVADLAAGLYLWSPFETSSPVPIADGDWVFRLATEYVDAPVLLFVCADIARACRASGSRGYSQLLVRAGAVGYGAWLAAASLGLAGYAFGDTHRKVTASTKQATGCPLRHLFTLAVGRR